MRSLFSIWGMSRKQSQRDFVKVSEDIRNRSVAGVRWIHTG